MECNNNNNYSIAIEKLLSECLKLQCESDMLIDDVVLNKEIVSVEDIEKSFNTAISTFQRTIDIINNIFKVETANQLTNEYKSYLESTINRKNELIQLKANVLSDKFKDSQLEVLMTLSDCVIYKWQENIDEINIEKEIIGNGSIYLSKAFENLHILTVKLEQQSSASRSQVKFSITRDTPILISNKGHYIIQIQDEFFGLLFPPNIPSVYLDLFEKLLSQVSTFVYLKPSSHNNNNINNGEITTIKEVDIPNFTIKSLKSMTVGLESGSSTIAGVILTTSAMISVSLRGGGMYLQSNLEKNKEPVQVSPFVSKSISIVKKVTPYAVSGSSFLIDSLAGLVEGVGSTFIGGIKAVLPEKDDSKEDEKNEVLNAASDFGKVSFKAIGEIVGALSDGITTIYQGASETTVDLVHHKFGKHVADVTNDSFSIGKDVVDTTLALGSAKSIALKVAKNGGIKIVENNFIEKTTTIECIESVKKT